MATKPNRGKTVALWLLAVAAVGVSFFFDDAVIAFVKTHSTPGVLQFGRLGSHYGQWNWLMVPCLLVLIVAGQMKKTAINRIVCIMILASVIGGLGANVSRAITGRTRPNAPVEQGWYGVYSQGKLLLVNSNYNAFPSAHATASMALIAPLFLLRRRLWWALLPLPIAISTARICVGAHHLSDVMAGMLLGFALGCWVTRKFGPRILSAQEFT